MATYYFERDGKQIGPMSLDEILALSRKDGTES